MSICFVRAWKVESLESTMAPWLSQKSVVGWANGWINLVNSFLIHISSFDACVRATYSDSVLDRVITGCFLELQDMILFPMKKA